MQNFKITISYDGTDFCGWQVQKNAPTVASCLQQSFKKVFDQSIDVLGTSRTDAGVHALGQVASFKLDIKIDEKTLLRAWNGALPQSVLIRKLEKVDVGFHPHRNVVQKIYYYHLFLKRPLPFFARYGWLYSFVHLVDWKKFEKALQLYVGEHDFRSFCKLEEDKSTIRTIDSIDVNCFSRYGVLQIVIKGESFLHFQIRRMIGYALDVARRPNLPLDYLKEQLDKPNPQQTLLKADGCGLCLRKVIYKK